MPAKNQSKNQKAAAKDEPEVVDAIASSESEGPTPVKKETPKSRKFTKKLTPPAEANADSDDEADNESTSSKSSKSSKKAKKAASDSEAEKAASDSEAEKAASEAEAEKAASDSEAEKAASDTEAEKDSDDESTSESDTEPETKTPTKAEKAKAALAAEKAKTKAAEKAKAAKAAEKAKAAKAAEKAKAAKAKAKAESDSDSDSDEEPAPKKGKKPAKRVKKAKLTPASDRKKKFICPESGVKAMFQKEHRKEAREAIIAEQKEALSKKDRKNDEKVKAASKVPAAKANARMEEMWKALSPKKQKKYEKVAAERKAVHDQALILVKPKGPPSGYILYGQELRERHKKEHVDMKPIADTDFWLGLSKAEKAKCKTDDTLSMGVIGAMWKTLPQEKRDKYDQKSKAIKADKAKLKLENDAWLFYLQENHENFVDDDTNKNEAVLKAHAKWEKLSDSKKKPYVEKAETLVKKPKAKSTPSKSDSDSDSASASGSDSESQETSEAEDNSDSEADSKADKKAAKKAAKKEAKKAKKLAEKKAAAKAAKKA